jgi:hypothetical protein
MNRDGTYWRERILLDDLATAYALALHLTSVTTGEPKYFPFSRAADALFELEMELREQLDAAGKNAFYKVDRKD